MSIILDHKWTWLFLWVLGFPNYLFSQVQLSEIVAKNVSSLIIENENPDWIELYNSSAESINLEGYYLSDNPDKPNKWTFPSYELAGNSFLIVLADDRAVDDGFLHTNFKISAEGETIIFSNANLEEIESVKLPPLIEDISYAKIDDVWQATLPTPNKENQQINIPQLSLPIFSATSRVVDAPFNLSIAHLEEVVELMYWINDLAVREVADNSIDLPINRSVIICAKATKKGYLSSEVNCQSYILDKSHQLPILSVIADNTALFDEEKGMFQAGPDAAEEWPFLGANFWLDKDTEVYFQYFNSPTDSIFFGHGDLEMHGGRESRTNPQKTFRLLAKNKYQQPFFQHSFFSAKPDIANYKRLVVRNASGDFNAGHCRDGFLQDYLVAGGLDLDANSYQPIAVYINGEYYGMMGLREKMDRYYTQSNYQTTEIDLLENNGISITGDTLIFQEQYNFLLENDLSNVEKFNRAASYFDIQNLTDYFIAQIGNVSTAWPQNNIKYWRPKTENGKWRFLLYDMDIALARHKWTLASENALLNKMTSFGEQNYFINIVNAFLANEEFKSYFFNRHQDLFNTVLAADRMLPAFDEFVKEVEGEMVYQFERWPTNTFEGWQTKEQEKIIDFIENRATFSMEHYDSYFELGGIYELTLSAKANDLVTFQLNSLSELPVGFRGRYFKKVPITVSAKETDNQRLEFWEIKQDGKVTKAYENPLTRNFDTATELTPVFTDKSPDFLATVSATSQTEINVNITSPSNAPIRLRIVDLLGRTLYENELNPVKIGHNSINIPVFPIHQGIYLLNIQQHEKNYTTKFFYRP